MRGINSYYRVKPAAEACGVNARTLLYAVERGELGTRLGDGLPVVTLIEVRRWMALERKPGPKPRQQAS